MKGKRILVVDDERVIRRTIREVLEYEEIIVDDVEDGQAALDKIKQTEYDVIMSDIKMPKKDGVELLADCMKLGIQTPFIMISGHADIDTAVEAIKNGAYDFIAKPVDLNRLIVSIKNSFDKNQLQKETKALKKQIKQIMPDDIIGDSEPIAKVKSMISKVAPTQARVLITGENGTGKELVAKAIHKQSERSSNPFIEVNCAAIPSELIESELFGHEKGAFTSAVKQKKGLFELANGGTLFLDEIGDMSLSAQAKVLKALQDNQVTRVGGEKPIKIDVRVIAATNKHLKQAVEEHIFREDLYHRLAVVLIHVPELSARKTDIPNLTNHFIKMICHQYGIKPKKVDSKAMKKLQTYRWTGNIRELKNVVERLIIFSEDAITEKHIEEYIQPNVS